MARFRSSGNSLRPPSISPNRKNRACPACPLLSSTKILNVTQSYVENEKRKKRFKNQNPFVPALRIPCVGDGKRSNRPRGSGSQRLPSSQAGPRAAHNLQWAKSGEGYATQLHDAHFSCAADLLRRAAALAL